MCVCVCVLGDVAYRLLDYRSISGEKSKLEITVLDANPEMLQEGMKKRSDSGGTGWYCG